MLKEINIKNIAIIDQLRVEFRPGLTIFTGETGAGKSIIIDALDLVLGGRASADLIRTGCPEAVVEASFDLHGAPREVRCLLDEQGIEFDENEDLIIRRVLSAAGKNKIYINGSLANLASLSSIGNSLADIHGQHEHQSLLDQGRQLDLLDALGGLGDLRAAVAETYRRLMSIRAELIKIESDERDRAQREDMLRFQKNEIESAMLRPIEDEELSSEQKVLANAERLAGLASLVDEVLYSSDASVLANIKKATLGIRSLVEIDPRLAEAFELCESGRAQIEEAARQIAAYRDRIEFDPQRLELVNDRLDLVQRLKKKYGSTVEDVIAFGARAAEELSHLERSSEEIERCKSEIQATKFELTDKVNELSKKRKAAARDLEKRVESELQQLAMKKTEFRVRITRDAGSDTLDGHKVGPKGADEVEFLIAPNRGEEPKPLASIASGGELSRIMLAIKAISVEDEGIPTLVFDEVDSGVGGAVAEEVGRKLKRIAKKHQVFCITHLPQIASMADHHYAVEKMTRKDRTTTSVQILDRQGSVDEISRMLAGKTITDATIRHAEEMIGNGRS